MGLQDRNTWSREILEGTYKVAPLSALRKSQIFITVYFLFHPGRKVASSRVIEGYRSSADQSWPRQAVFRVSASSRLSYSFILANEL